jgi:hypothetical protein
MTLHLQCALDEDDPYVAEPDAGICDSPTNIPDPEAENNVGGSIGDGAVTVFGPFAETHSDIQGGRFTLREVYNRDGSVEFTLTSFEADLADAAADAVAAKNVHLRLARPADGRLDGERVTFPAGALRFDVTAIVMIDGEPVFAGKPVTAQYSNFRPASAVRTADGFAIVDAAFRLGEHVAVLRTQAAPFAPVE